MCDSRRSDARGPDGLNRRASRVRLPTLTFARAHLWPARPLLAAGAALACLAGAAPAMATEYGVSNYLLGYGIPLTGFTPPPGFYYQNTFYLYSGSASANLGIPLGHQVGVGVTYQLILNISQISWVTDLKALGGSIGFAAVIPYGSEKTLAGADLTGPLGVTRPLNVSSETQSLADMAYAAFIGWENGEHHWSATLTGFAPTGHYDSNTISFTGINRPGVDIKGAYTFLSPTTGFEASAALGITINAVNTATEYQSGDELHFEWALNQHLPFGLSAGVGGYFYQQVTDDGGVGDERLGAFRGRVAAIGPLLSYTIKVGEQQVILSGRWLHEFAVENRVRGDSVFASLAFRL